MVLQKIGAIYRYIVTLPEADISTDKGCQNSELRIIIYQTIESHAMSLGQSALYTWEI